MKIVFGLDEKKWNDFVYNHSKGSIFQTPYMAKVYKESEKNEPFFIAVVSEKYEILASLLAVIQKEYNGILGNLSSRAIIIGGPIIKNDNKEVLTYLLEHYNKHIKGRVIYTQIRNLYDQTELNDIISKFGFKYEEHLNILINLNKTEESLWKDVHTKRRNEIRRATKEGVNFKILNTLEALKVSYNILTEVYSRAKLPMPSFSHFKSLLDNSGDDFGLRIAVAIYKEEIVGCMLILIYKGTIYDYYAGSYSSFYKKYPNHLIPWEVFKWGKKNDFSIFDFGGAGKPNIPYGVRDYKKKFGGDFVNYGRFNNIHKKNIYIIAKFGFLLWKKIKK